MTPLTQALHAESVMIHDSELDLVRWSSAVRTTSSSWYRRVSHSNRTDHQPIATVCCVPATYPGPLNVAPSLPLAPQAPLFPVERILCAVPRFDVWLAWRTEQVTKNLRKSPRFITLPPSIPLVQTWETPIPRWSVVSPPV